MLVLIQHDSHFELQKLAPGTYQYKYIVDGEWKHSPDDPAVSDNAGGFNNEITIAGTLVILFIYQQISHLMMIAISGGPARTGTA